MITPTILYQQMKKWVSKDIARPVFQCIYFDGQKAHATNTHRMAIVKDFPVKEAHYEYPEGYKADIEVPNPIDYDRLLVKEDNILWQHRMEFQHTDFKDFITPWKNAFDFILKICKKREYKSFILQKKGKQLYAYAVGLAGISDIKVKIVLLDNLEEGNDWHAGFNGQYIFDTIEFLRVTEPQELRIHINKTSSVITFETEDLIMLTTIVRITNDYDRDLVRFMESENQQMDGEHEAEDEEDDDTDFLG